MRTLVVGDVHGCADELHRLIEQVVPRDIVLVGDLFTKGPDPVGVWDLIQHHGIRAVLGNHDQRLLRLGKKDKKARLCAERLDRGEVPWRPFLESLPLFLMVGPFTVVHAGLHPSGSLDKTTKEMAIYMRRWPFGKKKAPHWHEVYEGERRVIFGHDAVGGLVRHERDAVPWLIGLDTGCVYGRRLSGYIVETDEIVSVPARLQYHAY